MRARPLITLDLILSLSKDEATCSGSLRLDVAGELK
jgi:hypothetical protein